MEVDPDDPSLVRDERTSIGPGRYLGSTGRKGHVVPVEGTQRADAVHQRMVGVEGTECGVTEVQRRVVGEGRVALGSEATLDPLRDGVVEGEVQGNHGALLVDVVRQCVPEGG